MEIFQLLSIIKLENDTFLSASPPYGILSKMHLAKTNVFAFFNTLTSHAWLFWTIDNVIWIMHHRHVRQHNDNQNNQTLTYKSEDLFNLHFCTWQSGAVPRRCLLGSRLRLFLREEIPFSGKLASFLFIFCIWMSPFLISIVFRIISRIFFSFFFDHFFI